MWAVLCGTLGVAYAVSHTLGTPSGQLVSVGAISLRLPPGFQVDNNPAPGLQARDSDKRLLLVLLVPNGRGDREFSETAMPIDFRGLNQTGRMSILKRTLSGPDGDSSQLMFTAAATIPSLNQQVVLELSVVEDESSGLTADRVILQKIANSVTLNPGAPTQRQRDHSKETVVFQIIPGRGAKL